MQASLLEMEEELDLELAAEIGAEMYRLVRQQTRDPDVLEEVRNMATEIKAFSASGKGLHVSDVQNLTIKQIALIHLKTMRTDETLNQVLSEEMTFVGRVVLKVFHQKYFRALKKIRAIAEKLYKEDVCLRNLKT